MLVDDPKFKKYFKFEHVWPILKDIENFSDDAPSHPGQSETQTSQSNTPSLMSPLSESPIASEEELGGASSQRPIGVKKAKLKRKTDDKNLKLIQSIREENRELVEIFKQSSADGKRIYELQMLRAQNESKKLDMKEFREENKIMAKDLSSIMDPIQLQYYQSEQARIWEKRNKKDNQDASVSFEPAQFFDINVAGSSDLLEY
ncbi:uncharacterized protein LOC141708169 [Apium graveolens]|uniref:uncharacterized protein LOC141708169 n=1 Tax=Apium graveolens TaxID=4045 RepID=UPI003D7B7183